MPPSSRSSSKRSTYTPTTYDDMDASQDCEYGLVGGAMLPIFLNDLRRNNQQDLVEVTLELDDDSIVVCSVAPTTAAAPVDSASQDDIDRASVGSRIRRKFGWLRSASSRTTSSSASATAAVDNDRNRAALTARDARRMKAKLQRTRSSAERALKGLRFISRTTGATDADELWKRVESRFEYLAKDGLLAREDFGECIG